MVIELPVASRAQEAAWHGLLDLADITTGGWTLVGGQLVQLHCVERGIRPPRATDDIDAVTDDRHHPKIYLRVTQHLADLGFQPVGVSPIGRRQHRWVRGEAMIDVLVPQNLKVVPRSVSGFLGLETPGVNLATRRSEVVEVRVGDRTGKLPRPNLLGAILAKSAAYSVSVDSERERHLDDLSTLASLTTAADLGGQQLTRTERRYLRRAHAEATDRLAESDPALAAGLQRVRRLLPD